MALFNCQVIAITIVAAVQTMSMPHWMQIIGLLCGIIGAWVLTMPDELLALWKRVTCQDRADRDVADDFKQA